MTGDDNKYGTSLNVFFYELGMIWIVRSFQYQLQDQHVFFSYVGTQERLRCIWWTTGVHLKYPCHDARCEMFFEKTVFGESGLQVQPEFES